MTVFDTFLQNRGRLQTLGRKQDLWRMSDYVFQEYNEQKDLTLLTNDILFPKIPSNKIRFIHSVIVGPPESGKSTLIIYRVWEAIRRYGIENVNFVYADDLLICIDRMDSKPFQYLIVDDALKNYSSTDMFKAETKDSLGFVFQMRHEFKRRTGRENGIVLVEFGFQRWKNLPPAFRNGMVVTHKALNTAEKGDREIVREDLGDVWYQELQRITGGIVKGNDRIKSKSVVNIPALAYENNSLGWYTSHLVDFPEFPDLMLKKDYKFRDKTLDPEYRKMLKELEMQMEKENVQNTASIIKQKQDTDEELQAHYDFEPSTSAEKTNARTYHAVYVSNWSLEEVAASDGVSVETIKKRIRTHKNRLAVFRKEGY